MEVSIEEARIPSRGIVNSSHVLVGVFFFLFSILFETSISIDFVVFVRLWFCSLALFPFLTLYSTLLDCVVSHVF